jgi:threonine synthase
MDIQVSSNFERLLFELKGDDGAAVVAAMADFRGTGRLPPNDGEWRAARRLFSAHAIDDTRTTEIIAETHAATGMLIDPHTAVAVGAARAEFAATNGDAPMVALATAHPAKFPDAVERATGIRPELPEALGDLFERREQMTVLPNDRGAVTRYIRAHARRGGRAE